MKREKCPYKAVARVPNATIFLKRIRVTICCSLRIFPFLSCLLTMEKTGSGFYIIDAFSLCQASRKPFHLEKRFLNSGENDMATTTTSLEEAEIKREALLQERREKLSRKFLEVQQVVKQAQARKESQRRVFQQSLQLAELKRKTHIEQRRAASKELVERAKVIARQNSLRFEAEQGILFPLSLAPFCTWFILNHD